MEGREPKEHLSHIERRGVTQIRNRHSEQNRPPYTDIHRYLVKVRLQNSPFTDGRETMKENNGTLLVYGSS